MSTENIPTRKRDGNREQTTVAELLSLRSRYNLPSAVRIALEDFAAGDDFPHAYIERDDAVYDFGEYLAAVMDDAGSVVHEKDALPASARDYVREYVYQLSERTEIYVYNTSDVMRAALPFMLDMIANNSGAMRAEEIAVRATIERFCTRSEIASFRERHGFAADEREARSPESADYDLALQAATLIADPRTPDETLAKLESEILQLSASTNTTILHPALVERALVVMFESMSEPCAGDNAALYEQDRQRDYKRLHDLLAEIEEGGVN